MKWAHLGRQFAVHVVQYLILQSSGMTCENAEEHWLLTLAERELVMTKNRMNRLGFLNCFFNLKFINLFRHTHGK